VNMVLNLQVHKSRAFLNHLSNNECFKEGLVPLNWSIILGSLHKIWFKM